MASIKDTVTSAMKDVAAEHNKSLAPLADSLPLLESGLDSLCFAILVARLENELDVDPFTASEDIVFPVTVGDLVKLYEDATARHAAA